MAADTAFPQKRGTSAIGINVFSTPRDRHDDLVAVLGEIADIADRLGLPRNMHSSFHKALDAPIVVNYVQYTERTGAFELADLARPLVDRTHEISTGHEMRWYETVDIVTAAGDPDTFSVVAGKDHVGVIAVYTVEAGKRDELLSALKNYAERVKSADGFKALALLRGQKPEFAATYEVWTSDAAYRRATENGAREAMERVRSIASDALIHSYEVVRVNRHKGAA